MKALSVTAYYINGAEVPNVPYIIDVNTPFNTTTTGKKTMTIYAEGQPLTYSYKVNYSDAELANLFKDANATLPFNLLKWKFWIEFKNLPAGATVVSVKREDLDAANLIDIGSTTKFRLKNTEYADLRDNGGHPITVVYEINGQQFAKVYKERFGTIKD